MQDPDRALVQALQAGDDQALVDLMARHKDGLFYFVRRFVSQPQDAEELTQEAFVRAYFKIRTFNTRAKFATWLYRIAHNLCKDYLRSRRFLTASKTVSSEDRIDNDSESQALSPDVEAALREKIQAVQRAIDHLPPEMKSPLVLVAVQGFSYEEAGNILKISAKAIEMKVYRARKLLLEKMRESGF